MADPLVSLRAAYAARDPNAEVLRRELARTSSPTSDAYYDLLCLIAERAHHGGEQCRAESLLRRAAQLADIRDRDPNGAADRLAGWIAEGMRCDPEVARASPPTCTVVEVELTCSLMRFDDATLDHVAMMRIDDRWLLVTSIASGGGKLAARCAVVIDGIMAHNNRGLAAPYDPHYIAAQCTAARLVGSAELGAVANSLRRSAWSPSPIYVVDGARFTPVALPQLLALAS